MQGNSVIRNTSSLFIAHLTVRILSFVLIVILPRYLEDGFSDLGRYLTSLWLANLLAAFTELGLYTPLIRDIASDRSKASSIISNALAIRLIFCIFALLIILLLARYVYPDMIPLIYILGISETIGAITQLLWRVFRAFERMGFEAFSLLLEKSLAFSLGLYVVMRGYGIVSFCIVALMASLLNLALTFSIMIWKFSRPGLKFLSLKLSGRLLKRAIPFALGDALSTVYFRIDGLMLKYLMGARGNLAMGWYGTAYNLVMSLTIIPGAFMGALFPVMSRMLHSSASAMNFLYTRSLKLMLIIAFPITVGVAFMSEEIIHALYSTDRFNLQSQEALSRIIEILIWACMLSFLNCVLLTVFRAADKRRTFLMVMTASVSVNIVSNLILIPKYAHLGPAISMVASEFVLFIFSLWNVHRHVCRLTEFGFIFKSAFASGILALGLFVWKYSPGFNDSIPLALIICLSIITYFAIIIALKGLTREDVAMVRGQFHNLK